MLSFFKPIPIYILFYIDKIKVYRLDNGLFIERNAVIPFSNSKILFANFTEGERFLSSLISELVPRLGSFFSRSLIVLAHQIEMINEGLSQVEERALIDAIRHSSAVDVFVIEGGNELTKDQALQKLKMYQETKQ
ncbi:hypothetical protein BTO06_12910 [Tenacibaculum sp. SZ-18]|uniref:hypothetical protein n=1 Tax=Tenacibaculum sp. SZ-18 TaxID=754423 RepID=UPI000C2CF6A6|nr:hypothetical protein [Tenacibaculum sp. SZ-18]AUC16000.1 hypothetical protein BTO06_12910 [Tenacibaculum sp. SZ-18]